MLRQFICRNSLWLCIALAVGLCGCDRWTTEHAAVIVGDSMAPTLHGQHWLATCDECGITFAVSAGSQDRPSEITCPNCGFSNTEPRRMIARPANRVIVVDRPRKSLKSLKRWDVIAFRTTQSPDTLIKRIVGLPNETLEILGGDLFANGRQLVKPMSINRATRIPVFDSQFQAASLPPRWRSESTSSGWQTVDDQFAFHPLPGSNGDIDWLTYHHHRGYRHNGQRDQDFPIQDNYANNQSLNRNLHNVDDLFLSLDCQLAPHTQLTLRFERSQQQHDFTISADQSIVSYIVRTVAAPATLVERRFRIGPIIDPANVAIEFCTFDQRLVMNINQKSITIDLVGTAPSQEIALHPIRIGVTDDDLTIRRIQLWRDLYYFDIAAGKTTQTARQMTAGPSEYLVLGDNVPVSVDSRHWAKPGISVDRVLGTVEPTEKGRH